MQFFFEIVLIIGYISIIVSFLIGVFRFVSLSNDQRLLLILICLTIFVELVARALWKIYMNNLFLYHFYSVIEFFLLATLYKKHLEGLLKPIWMNILIAVFVVFAVLNTLFFQGLAQFNSNVTFIECLLLIALSLLYFYKLLHDMEYRALERNPMFWVNISVLTYFSGALVLFHVANDLIPEPLKVRGAVWGVHALFNVVHYILYAMALWVSPEQKTNKKISKRYMEK